MKSFLPLTVAFLWTLSLWAGGKTASGLVSNQQSQRGGSTVAPPPPKGPPVGPGKSGPKHGHSGGVGGIQPPPGASTTATEGQDYHNSQSALFKWIRPGTFQMGSTKGTDPDRYHNEDQHTVTLTQGFWLSDHEVTQGEYQAVMGYNPSDFRGDLNRPVERVSWDDAVLYCQTLTTRERDAGRITAQQAYRLPTEAEWEYAARAGTTGARYTYQNYDVAQSLDKIAWLRGNSKTNGSRQTHPVKQKAPNAWGLYDMIGNVWEWCSDWYDDYPTGSVTDPKGPGLSPKRVRVFRGGSWGDVPRDARSAVRYWRVPGFRYFDLGFRPALSSVR
ncbi:MAG: formylglycine-generating enzyme family protein [Solirubrobacterales bacterium]